jgi:phosphatidylglycerophosphate synthase
MFGYQTLDNMDGKQARRTGTSSALGFLFDHGCDALNSFVSSVHVAACLGLGWDYGIIILFNTFLPFFMQSWEHYFVGEFILPVVNGPSEGILVCVGMLICSATFGSTWWQIPVYNFPNTLLIAVLKFDKALATFVPTLFGKMPLLGSCLAGLAGTAYPFSQQGAEEGILTVAVSNTLDLLAGFFGEATTAQSAGEIDVLQWQPLPSLHLTHFGIVAIFFVLMALGTFLFSVKKVLEHVRGKRGTPSSFHAASSSLLKYFGFALCWLVWVLLDKHRLLSFSIFTWMPLVSTCI